MKSSRRALSVTAAACLFSVIPDLLAANDAASPKEETQKLVGVLKSEAPLFEKAKACQRLAVVGTKEAIPVLSALLGDEKLAHYARFALEPIPDPSVDDAFREALGTLKGRLLVGVINSLGARRDPKAIGPLTKLMSGPDGELAPAAVAALGRIGTSEAAAALGQALSSAPPALRPAISEASLACAERLLAQGRREEAVGLYDSVRKAELPEHIQAAAMRGAIVARKADGLPLLIEKLQTGDPVSLSVALVVTRELEGNEVTRALVENLGKLSPERQALVIAALGDRGDGAARPRVLEAAKSAPPQARLAAIRALRRLGDASSVPVLLEAAARSGEESAAPALETLEDLGGKEVDAAIASMLSGGDRRLRPVVIDLVGRRHIASAVPALKKAADEEDAELRSAAIRALGMTVSVDDLPVLLSRFVAPQASQDAGAVEEALKTAVRRLPDKDGSAGKVLDAMSAAHLDTKRRLLVILGAVGGKKALEAVAASARASDEATRKAATSVLGEWTSEDAAPELLLLVKASSGEKDRSDALRGFSRVVSRLRFPKEERLALCGKAMDAARDDAEKKIVLETLAAIPAVETIPLLTPYLANAALKEDASAALVTIGERILRYQPAAVKDSMKQVLQATSNKDLTERAKALLKQAGE
jgi:HEAT repeat protein